MNKPCDHCVYDWVIESLTMIDLICSKTLNHSGMKHHSVLLYDPKYSSLHIVVRCLHAFRHHACACAVQTVILILFVIGSLTCSKTKRSLEATEEKQ